MGDCSMFNTRHGEACPFPGLRGVTSHAPLPKTYDHEWDHNTPHCGVTHKEFWLARPAVGLTIEAIQGPLIRSPVTSPFL